MEQVFESHLIEYTTTILTMTLEIQTRDLNTQDPSLEATSTNTLDAVELEVLQPRQVTH